MTNLDDGPVTYFTESVKAETALGTRLLTSGLEDLTGSYGAIRKCKGNNLVVPGKFNLTKASALTYSTTFPNVLSCHTDIVENN